MRTVLITGANSGMGFTSTVELAKQGFYVIMACRDMVRGQQALEEAKIQSNSNRIELMQLDLSSLKQIRSFAEQFNEKFRILDVLLNNAGVMTFKRTTTAEGFESMLGVNHLGHFLLTNLLLEPLKLAPQGRIVTVASSSHNKGKIDFNDPHWNNTFDFMKAYGQSKLANVLFTLELSDRMQGTRVTANCLDPGTVSTNIGVDRQNGYWARMMHRLMRPFVASPLKGAETAIYLASAKEVEGISGKYFKNKQPATVSADGCDKRLALALWEWSEKEVKL